MIPFILKTAGLFAAAALCVMLAGCGTYTGEGRTTGEIIDDAYIERTAQKFIRDAHEDMGGARIKVVSVDARVLLAGEVPSDELKTLAEQAVLKVRQVRGIHNELVVSAKPAFLARTNDSLTTSKVKTRLLSSEDVSGLRIKVVTVNNLVYLMGNVREAEGQKAADLAAGTPGVLGVVKLFEYVQVAPDTAPSGS